VVSDDQLTATLTATQGSTPLVRCRRPGSAPQRLSATQFSLLLASPGSCQTGQPMADRPKHPRKELEAVIREAEARGWRVSKGKGYFRMLCPCGKHKKWVALTPSDPRYGTNLGKWLARQSCWEGGER